MKIIKKYILFCYLKPFLNGFFAFLLIMMITHFFDYLHVFLENKPPLSMLIKYFLYRLPEWAVNITPVATLLGVLFSLSTLNRNHEITAIKSSGINLIYIIKPLVIFSIFVSILTGVIYEGVVPETTSKAEELFLIIRKRHPKKKDSVRKDFTYMGENRRLYRIRRFENNTIQGLNIIEFFPGSLREKKRIFAETATYTGDSWKMKNVTIRTFSFENGQPDVYEEFDEKMIMLSETPDNFRRPSKTAEQMGFFTLLKYIRKLKKGGFSTLKERVLLHYKISFPFSNTIILILGIPIALWGGLMNRTTGFFISILICFIYWGAISVGRALGINGILPPILGAWAANLTFLLISLMLMKFTRII